MAIGFRSGGVYGGATLSAADEARILRARRGEPPVAPGVFVLDGGGAAADDLANKRMGRPPITPALERRREDHAAARLATLAQDAYLGVKEREGYRRALENLNQALGVESASRTAAALRLSAGTLLGFGELRFAEGESADFRALVIPPMGAGDSRIIQPDWRGELYEWRIDPRGGDFQRKAAGVIPLLSEHKYDFVLGRVVDVNGGEDGVFATLRFRDTPTARGIARDLSAGKYPKGVSAGITPLRWTDERTPDERTVARRTIHEWHLREVSLASQPAIPGAAIQ